MSILRNRFSNNLFNKSYSNSGIPVLMHVSGLSKRRYNRQQKSPIITGQQALVRNNLLSRKLDKLEVIVALIAMIGLVWFIRS